VSAVKQKVCTTCRSIFWGPHKRCSICVKLCSFCSLAPKFKDSRCKPCYNRHRALKHQVKLVCTQCNALFVRDTVSARCSACRTSKCSVCGSAKLSAGADWCAQCLADKAKARLGVLKAEPRTLNCSKCSASYTNTNPYNCCEACLIVRRATRWVKVGEHYKAVRNTDEQRARQKRYHERNRAANEAVFLNLFGDGDNKYCCQECGFGSRVKRQFSLHHRDPSKKTLTFAQLLRRGSFTVDHVNSESVEFVCENCHRMRHAISSKYKQTLYGELFRLGVADECALCQRTWPLPVYDLHHVDPLTKSFSVGSRRLKIERALAEAAKCVLLCARCHRLVDSDPAGYSFQPLGEVIHLVV